MDSPAYQAVQRSVSEQANSLSCNNFRFFTVKIWKNHGNYPFAEASFYVYLEQKLHVRLTYLDPQSAAGISPLSSGPFLYLVCKQDASQSRDNASCLREFSAERKNYQLLSQIYQDDYYQIYLFK